MSNQLYSYLDSIYSKLNKLSLVTTKKKTKKHDYIIKDGIIQMKVKFDEKGINCMMCKNPSMCNLRKCHHVYFILIKILKIKISQLTLLWKDDNWENFIKNNIINEDFSNEECGICLEEIEQNGKINFSKIYQCLDCGCFVHNKCINKAKEKHCLFCYSPFDKNIF